MAQCQRASRCGPAGKSHQANEIVRATFEVSFLSGGREPPERRPRAAVNKKMECFLDSLQPAQGLTFPVEIRRRHAAAGVDHHLNGDALRGDARSKIGPTGTGQRRNEKN